METPVSVKEADHSEREEAKSDHEQSFATALDVGGLFVVSESDSLVVFGTAATANLLCSGWRQRHNRILRRGGFQRVPTDPAFGDGRLDEVRSAADNSADTAGSKGELTAFALDADIPECLRNDALEALWGTARFLTQFLVLPQTTGGCSRGSRPDGRYILSVIEFGRTRRGK